VKGLYSLSFYFKKSNFNFLVYKCYWWSLICDNFPAIKARQN